MKPFCKLAWPGSYVACDWDLSKDGEGRSYWVGFFKRHLENFLKMGSAAALKRGCSEEDCAKRAADCTAEFFERFDRFHAEAGRQAVERGGEHGNEDGGKQDRAHGRVTIITLGAWRNEILWKHGFDDCFIDLKERENSAALEFLPAVCREIDGLEGEAKLRAVIEGVFAGNIFDMGAEATARRFMTESPDFFETRKGLPGRPWLIDDFDRVVGRWIGEGAGKKLEVRSEKREGTLSVVRRPLSVATDNTANSPDDGQRTTDHGPLTTDDRQRTTDHGPLTTDDRQRATNHGPLTTDNGPLATDPPRNSQLATRNSPYKKCVFFIDNAGSDFILGVVPLVRYLAMGGTRVVMAANERPTLNDMTVADVRRWWPRVLEIEPSLARLPIEIVSTGTGEPLIDLLAVSDELNAAATDADLVILEGMGRGVESNLDAEFTCDALNLAMLKDEAVSRRVGGKVYDVVCRFR